MKTKKIALLGVLLALNICLSSIYIPVGPNLRIYITFIINMFIATQFSYPICLIYAVVEDILSFFIFPSGSFFFGYTLTAALSISIYWLFLHKKVTIQRAMISKFCVNMFINVLLGSLWSYMLYSKGYLYYLGNSVVKNLILFPIEATIFFILNKQLKKLVDKYQIN